MSPGHTPGPWAIFERDIRAGAVCCVAHRVKWWANGMTESEEMANARLIGSAPDLLAERDRLKAANAELSAALEGLLNITRDSCGVAGYHRNGDVAEWDEFPEVGAGSAALAKHNGETT